MAIHRANKGVVVTTGLFESGAHKLSETEPIELIDGNHLIPLMNKHLGSTWTAQVDRLVREAEVPGEHIHPF